VSFFVKLKKNLISINGYLKSSQQGRTYELRIFFYKYFLSSSLLKQRSFKKKVCFNLFRLKNAESRHREKSVEARCRQHAINDLNKYYIALNWAIMRFHQVFVKDLKFPTKLVLIRLFRFFKTYSKMNSCFSIKKATLLNTFNKS